MIKKTFENKRNIGRCSKTMQKKCNNGVCDTEKKSDSVKRIDINYPREEKYYENVCQGYIYEPVDIRRGAHIIDLKVFSLLESKIADFRIKYDSMGLIDSELGIGWHHNFEKRVEIKGMEARLYETPYTYIRFRATSKDCINYQCITKGAECHTISIGRSNGDIYHFDAEKEILEYYDKDGCLIGIRDKEKNEMVISYSENMVTITESSNRKSMYIEKKNGQISRVYDDNRREAIFTYSGGMLVCVRDVIGNTYFYSYDSEGRVISCIDPKFGQVFENTYDNLGRVSSQEKGEGISLSLFEYNASQTIMTTLRNGAKNVRYYDSCGTLLNYVDEEGNKIKNPYVLSVDEYDTNSFSGCLCDPDEYLKRNFQG